MRPCRLHILGASGAGTTTLGRAVASEWSVPHADVDDYFWRPTVPAYTTKRPVSERLALMKAVFLPRDAWVLSGSMISWGDELRANVDAVVFLTLAPATRLDRLRAREMARYGDAIATGGSLEEAHLAFLEWAGGYDDPEFDGRSRVAHEQWLSTLTCPVLRLDSARPTADLVAEITAWTPE